MERIIKFSVEHPKIIIIGFCLAIILAISQFPRIKVDTDPENMLSKKEFVRVFHNKVKKEFSLYDFIVLGVINTTHQEGVFNVSTLNRIYKITQEIKKIDGVVSSEIISPATKDDIEQAGLGAVRFKWLMDGLLHNEEDTQYLKERIMANPIFYGTMVSEDGKAIALYIPIKQKKLSYKISRQIRGILAKYSGPEKYYITGLPVAEDTFGHEMFVQMAISAPLAGLIIFLLMLWFFREMKLIVIPMILAVGTVILTMGLLIGFGFPVHIMSSMIPIFLIPISVLDSVHILSEFFDHYREYRNSKEAILNVIKTLFVPMLYTSLTTFAGFFSLYFSPIPPVQVFGIFVAIGVGIAWILTMIFIPACIVLIKKESLSGFGKDKEEKDKGVLGRSLLNIGNIAINRWRIILGMSIGIIIISFWGISRIQVNDNPVKWFTKKHPIRIADTVLNQHFAGTYIAYLVLENKDVQQEIFKSPKMLSYVERLQKYLQNKGSVGKTSSLVDVVKKVYFELMGAEDKYYTIPNTKRAVAQTLISFQNSHHPDDIWHFVTPDYAKLNIWLQLKSGDNKDMERVIKQVDEFVKNNPPPYKIDYNWAGLTYVNVAWQNKMVVGMLRSFWVVSLLYFL